MILIYGKGKSGLSAFNLAKKKGLKAVLVDDFSFKENQLKDISIIVVSPGIPFKHKIFQISKKYRIPIIGEVEFAYRFWKGKIIAITGTDGKSTTTKLIYDILKAEKEDIFIGGNYGTPFSDIVLERETGTAVLELSSFQIYSTVYFKPHKAVFLNISVDHLDWHRKFNHYLYSKYKLFKRQTSDNYAILNFDSKYTRKTKTKAKKIYFSLKKLPDGYEGAFLDKNFINVRIKGKEEKIIDIRNLPVKGIHFVQNTMAALLTTITEIKDISSIKKQIYSFQPLPFRLEYEGSINGVDIYNDAKSTTVQSLQMAIRSFPDKKIVVIAGGINKGGDFSTLKKEKNVKSFILIGRDKESIYRQLKDYFKVYLAKSLDEALRKSLYIAEKGDIILFSPACASFDMFKNYIDRGEKFKNLVKGLIDDKRFLL